MFIDKDPLFQNASLDWPKYTAKSLDVKSYSFFGESREVALPVTFTPFASVEPCTARCSFCSETLVHKHTTQLSASLRPSARYAQQLAQALNYVKNVPIGVSLSGLEATSQAKWLLEVLDVLESHHTRGGKYDEKILYSNGTGLAVDRAFSEDILRKLRHMNWSRVEMSRHSVDQKANDLIMRYRKNVSVQDNAVFSATVRRTHSYVPVKLVCILQEGGVSNTLEVERYLQWAEELGVNEVVFRELSRLQGLYRDNIPALYVESHRVGIESVLTEVLKNDAFTKEELVNGYYYWNAQFMWRNKVRVIFETSDYEKMKQLHQSDIIYKFVFHANGNLCADWDPNTKILFKAEG